MLGKYDCHATIACSDIERAKTWYEEKLGLTPLNEDQGGLYYECGGTGFLLFPTPFAGTAKNTVMEWSVDDLAPVMEDMRGRGVTFDHYDIPGVEWEGDIALMGGTKGAWFKDGDGNILALTENRAERGSAG